MLAAWYLLVGFRAELGVLLQWLLSAGGVVLVYVAGRQFCGPAAAVVGAGLLVVSGLQARFSGVVMSEPVGFALASGVVAALATRGPLVGWRWGLAGALAAYLGTVRPTNWLGAAALLAAAGITAKSRREWVGLAVGSGLVVLPWVRFRLAQFDSVLSTGYSFWFPAEFITAGAFSPLHLFRTERGPGSLQFFGSLFIDPRSPIWPHAGVALLCVGALNLRSLGRGAARTAWIAAAVMLLPFAPILTYAWPDERFLVPFLPLLAMLTSFGLESMLRKDRRSRRVLGCILAGAALIHAAMIWPWSSPHTPVAEFGEVSGLRAARTLLRPGDVLVTDTPLVLATWEVPEAGVLALRLEDDEHLARIFQSGLRPLHVKDELVASPLEGFPAPCLFFHGKTPLAVALRSFEVAWNRGAHVYVLLARHRKAWLNLRTLLRPIKVRRVRETGDWILLSLDRQRSGSTEERP
jgi:hypothetical protein